MKITDKLLEFIDSTPAHDERSTVTLCYAQSIDGGIAVQRGTPLRMSGHRSRALSHLLRASHDTSLVGIGTIITDNPQLSVRHVQGDDPQPVILDSSLRFPINARLLSNQRKPWIFTNDRADIKNKEILEQKGVRVLRAKATPENLIDLHYVLRELKFMGMERVLVEGGARIIEQFIRERVVDRYVLFITPVIIGGLHAVEQTIEISTNASHDVCKYPWLSIAGFEQCENDLVVWGKFK